MVNGGGWGELWESIFWNLKYWLQKKSDENFQFVLRKAGIGDGTHFHTVSFCSHRLGKSSSVVKEPVLPLGQLFSETVNFHNTGENQSHLERKRLAEASVSKSSSALRVWRQPKTTLPISDEPSLNSSAPSCWMPTGNKSPKPNTSTGGHRALPSMAFCSNGKPSHQSLWFLGFLWHYHWNHPGCSAHLVFRSRSPYKGFRDKKWQQHTQISRKHSTSEEVVFPDYDSQLD